jgi:4-hydroxy-tetrahydrodipicolinate synthase
LAEIPNIVGTKEASGDLTQIGYIRALTDESFQIYSGNDGDTLPMLPLGCCGVISVASHVVGPQIREMMEAYWKGEVLRAREIHLRLLPLIDALFPPTTPSPAPIKAAVQLQAFDCGNLRLPLVECTDAEREAVRVAMKDAGVL